MADARFIQYSCKKVLCKQRLIFYFIFRYSEILRFLLHCRFNPLPLSSTVFVTLCALKHYYDQDR